MKTINESIALAITCLAGAMHRLSTPDMDGRNASTAQRELKTCLRELVRVQLMLPSQGTDCHVYVNEPLFTREYLLRVAERQSEVTP